VNVSAEERYLCELTLSAGMKFIEEKSEWDRVFFSAGTKYIVAPPPADSRWSEFTFVVTKLGGDYPNFQCDSGFNSFGFLGCAGLDGSFKMNNRTLRSQVAHEFGYVVSDKADDGSFGTPYIAIGVCSPF
jgi:hypothetical protein